MLRALGVLLVLLAGVRQAPAEFFARDKNTILEIQNLSEGKPESYQLTVYGSPDEDGVLYGYGQFQAKEGGSFIAKSGDTTLEITPQADGSLNVRAKGFMYSSGAHALQPFDASGVYKPLSEKQRQAWSKQRFDAADAMLNSTYSRVLAAEPKRAKALRELQRDWLGYRDSMAEFNDDSPDAKSANYWNEMASQTATRIEFLKAWAGELEVNDSLSGTYRDFYGGEIVVNAKKAKLDFAVNVVRGPSLHTGELGGTATLKGKKAEFRDENNPPAILRFDFLPNHVLKLEGENTSEYHGARAYFDGTYYKVSNDARIEEDQQ